jgi:hypothetical protein
MATKTISLKLEAWERLRAARRTPDESFSQVILRAEWPDSGISAADYLERRRREGPAFSEEGLAQIDLLDRGDRPPEDKWKAS